MHDDIYTNTMFTHASALTHDPSQHEDRGAVCPYMEKQSDRHTYLEKVPQIFCCNFKGYPLLY